MKLLRFNDVPVEFSEEDLIGIDPEGPLIRVTRKTNNGIVSNLGYHVVSK